MSELNIDVNSAKHAFELLDYNKEKIIDIDQILDNLIKLGFDKTHPEICDLIDSLGANKMNYNEFEKMLTELIRQKEDDIGLQRIFDLLLFNPKLESIDGELLKKIGDETGNHLTDYEVKYILNKAGNGKTISLESFIEFMKN